MARFPIGVAEKLRIARTTDRTVAVAGVHRLAAQFKTNAWSARIEPSFRHAGFWADVAGKFTSFVLRKFAEQAIVGQHHCAGLHPTSRASYAGAGRDAICAVSSPIGLGGDPNHRVKLSAPVKLAA